MEPFDKYFSSGNWISQKSKLHFFEKKIPILEIWCGLELKVLLATNPGGGKLVLLAASEMEQDFSTQDFLTQDFLNQDF